MPGGHLKLTYWWSPPVLTIDDIEETDSNGDLTKGPSLPFPLWNILQNYAKWILAEQVGDEGKIKALSTRFKGPHGFEARIRSYLASFQTEEQVTVVDNWDDEV